MSDPHALAAVQAWLRAGIPDPAEAGDVLSPEAKVEGARLVRLFTEVLAPQVLRLAERCAREGMVVGADAMRLTVGGDLTMIDDVACVQRALTAEDRGTDG